MSFDPAGIPDDSCVEGHLDGDPIYDVLIAIHRAKATGRLAVEDPSGPNHMFFMKGMPVGVSLAEYVHPFGQLLLELGRVNGATFVRAQRLIAEGNRLAGQVFKEMGVLDEDTLLDVLAIQARKKAEHFCRLGSRPFNFCRGLTYLTGFTATPLELWVVVFLAVRAQLGPDARLAWIESARNLQVRVQNAPGDAHGLPAPLYAFGFGAAEERFLQRILGGWEKVSELCDKGTLPADEAAVLLRFLEVIGRLDKREPPAVPAHISALTKRPPELGMLAVPEALDDVFSSLETVEVQSPTADAAPAAEDRVFAGPEEVTDPRRRSIHDDQTLPFGEAEPLPFVPSPSAASQRPRFRSVSMPEPLQNAPPVPAAPAKDDFPAPVVKKKSSKRAEPMPSQGSGIRVSETRKEKTTISPMPSIVIDEE